MSLGDIEVISVQTTRAIEQLEGARANTLFKTLVLGSIDARNQNLCAVDDLPIFTSGTL